MATVILVVVSHVVDVKSQHHGVVFVNRVVTVHWIASGEVAEAEVNLDIVVLTKSDDVLAAALDQGWRISVSFENLVLLEMNMDWVRPIKSAFELPNLGGVSLYPEPNIITVKQLIVDNPLAVPPVKLEAPRNALGDPCWHQVKGWVGCGIHAVVGYRIRNHAELKHLVPLARRQDIVSWSSPIALLQPVLQVDD